MPLSLLFLRVAGMDLFRTVPPMLRYPQGVGTDLFRTVPQRSHFRNVRSGTVSGDFGVPLRKTDLFRTMPLSLLSLRVAGMDLCRTVPPMLRCPRDVGTDLFRAILGYRMENGPVSDAADLQLALRIRSPNTPPTRWRDLNGAVVARRGVGALPLDYARACSNPSSHAV